ncbi:uncharacterized protein LOC144742566 [Ciona intestinalis]
MNVKEIANEIRTICNKNGVEEKPKESAKLLHKLAKVLRKSEDKISLIQATTLMNAALLRMPDNKEIVEQDLKLLCKGVLKSASVKQQSVDLVQKAKRFKRQVDLMRGTAKDKIQKVFKKIGPGSCLSQVERQNVERREMYKVQTWITDYYTKIMKDISKCCVEILGTAPCRFALVGMGSLARKEITPFSDFENVIVLEEGVQKRNNLHIMLEYFRWFAVIFQVILINFGETIIPSVAIPCLNNFEDEEENWFYDAFTPSGISFDGLMPHACKTALGRQKPTKKKNWTTELIKPVSQMLHYLSEEQDLKNGYHLADILTTTCFVHGDEEVYKEFARGAAASRKAKFQNVSKDANHIQDLKKDFKKYNVLVNLRTGYDTPKYNLKSGFYRLTTLFISELGMKHDVSETSSFMVVKQLYEKGIITSKQRDQFSYAVAIACRLRLMVYMQEKRQSDMMKHLVHKTSSGENVGLVQILGEESTVDYFVIADTLQKFVAKEFHINQSDFTEYSWDQQGMQILVCFYLKMFDRLCHFFETVLEPQHRNDKVTSTVWIETMSFYATTLLQIGKYSKSVKVNEQVIQLLEKQTGHPLLQTMKFRAINNYAFGLLQEHRYDEGLKYHLKGYTLLCKCIKNSTFVRDGHTALALITGNVAMSYFKLGQYESALEYAIKQFEMLENRSSDRNYDKEIALCCNNVAVCHFHLRTYEPALKLFNEAIGIVTAIESIETTNYNQPVHNSVIYSIRFNSESEACALNHPYVDIRPTQSDSDITNIRDKTTFLTNKAVCLFRLKQFKESYELHKKVVEIRRKYFVHTEFEAAIEESEVNVESSHEMMTQFEGSSPPKKKKQN